MFTRTPQTPGQVWGNERHVFPSILPANTQLFPDGQTAEESELTHERWCNHLAAKLLCVSVLDRFGDFVSDQVMQTLRLPMSRELTILKVVAPVRETVSQTLASLLLHMPRRSVLHVHSILLQMIRQDFSLGATINTLPSTTKNDGALRERTHVWEVRHAGLLGIKYEVAVRSDLVQADDTKEESEPSNRKILRDVVDATVLG